jgi:nicotinate-nucleotide adenylyltransferase
LSRIGLFGGSFDPIHRAHVALGRRTLDVLDLDGLQFIPAGDPWQRPPLKASPTNRLAMVKLAIQDEPAMSVNDSEIHRSGKTYTIDTVRQLPDGAHYTWLLGSDQLANFCSWRDWAGIVDKVDLAVAARPGTPLAAPAELADYLKRSGRVLAVVAFPPDDVSSSEIRRRIGLGLRYRDLVDPRVAQYIDEHSLYHSSPSSN